MPRHLPSCCAAAMLAVISFTLSAQPGNSSVPLPRSMRFCAFYCFTLVQSGDHYDAYRDDGMDGKPASTYRVHSFSRDSVEIDRQDSGGNSAVLSGRISASGNSVENGRIVWKANGKSSAYPYQLTWGEAIGSATPNTVTHGFGAALLSTGAPVRPPEEMHFCAYNCMTLALRGGRYVVTSPLPGALASYTSEWKIERFSPEMVILRRHDTPAFAKSKAFDAVYTGQISADGNRIVNLRLDGNPVGGMMLVWGLSLGQIPGSNQERDKALRAVGVQNGSNDAEAMLLLFGLMAFGGMDSGGPPDGSGVHYNKHISCDYSYSNNLGCSTVDNGASDPDWKKMHQEQDNPN